MRETGQAEQDRSRNRPHESLLTEQANPDVQPRHGEQERRGSDDATSREVPLEHGRADGDDERRESCAPVSIRGPDEHLAAEEVDRNDGQDGDETGQETGQRQRADAEPVADERDEVEGQRRVAERNSVRRVVRDPCREAVAVSANRVGHREIQSAALGGVRMGQQVRRENDEAGEEGRDEPHERGRGGAASRHIPQLDLLRNYSVPEPVKEE